LQVAVRGPDAVHPVLGGEAPRLPLIREGHVVPGLEPPAGVLWVGFQHQRAQAPLGQMQRGGQPGQPAADDEDVGRGGVHYRVRKT
jgi:hypothetical protein